MRKASALLMSLQPWSSNSQAVSKNTSSGAVNNAKNIEKQGV
jgi:hypothetical protein